VRKDKASCLCCVRWTLQLGGQTTLKTYSALLQTKSDAHCAARDHSECLCPVSRQGVLYQQGVWQSSGSSTCSLLVLSTVKNLKSWQKWHILRWEDSLSFVRSFVWICHKHNPGGRSDMPSTWMPVAVARQQMFRYRSRGLHSRLHHR